MTAVEWIKEHCGPANYGERDENGVDLSLIRANLKLSPLERLRRGDQATTDALWLREHASRSVPSLDISTTGNKPQITTEPAPPPELITTLAAAVSPVVAGHVTPDVDAMGSMLALARALPSPQAMITLPGIPVSQKLRFMLELAGKNVPIAGPERVAAADLVAVVDTAGTNRVHVPGKWEAIAEKLVVNIDHHITNPDYGRVNWVLPHASSSCELIHRLIATAGWPLDATTASLLYAGIHADTGGFSLPNTTAGALESAAALVRAGADVERIGVRLCRSQERHEFDLMRTVYHNTRVLAEGQITYSTLTYDEIKTTGCSPDDIDDQVSIPRSLSGTRIAMLFSEGERGVIRINFRGENGTAVIGLAERLGGGGHTFSAGARIRGQMEPVVERVLTEAQATLAG